MQNDDKLTVFSHLLSALGFKAEYLENRNFKMLLEREINLRDNYNDTVLMYLYTNFPNLLNYSVFTTLITQ